MVASIADRIPASIGLPTRKASCHVPKCIQLLGVKSSIMPRNAAIVWALTAEVIMVAEFSMSNPRVDRFYGFDMRIDSLSKSVAVDDWFWPASTRPVLDVAEYALEIPLSKMW